MVDIQRYSVRMVQRLDNILKGKQKYKEVFDPLLLVVLFDESLTDLTTHCLPPQDQRYVFSRAAALVGDQ